jgi:hypothetical protein
LPGVDATIVAALISGGVGVVGIVGTVATSMVGSRNTRRATEQAIAAGAASTRATLVAAREDRLWERRCAAYEAMLAQLLHNQMKRFFDAPELRADAEIDQIAKGFFDKYAVSDRFETQAQLVAYASDTVTEAHKATREADATVRAVYSHTAALSEQVRVARASGSPQSGPDASTLKESTRELDAALNAATAADEALIKVIRDELRSRPEAATPPPALPAVRRRSWLRHRG